LSKNESFIHMAEWILLLTQQLLSDQHLLPHMREDANANRQLHCHDVVMRSIACQVCSRTLLSLFMLFNCLNAFY